MCGKDATLPEHVDLIISGAGISGLIAGIRAQQLGLKCLVVEKQKSFAETLRGEYIQPVGMTTLRQLGLATEIEKAGIPIHAIHYHYWPMTRLSKPKFMEFAYSGKNENPGFAVAMPHLALKDILVRRFTEVGGRLIMNSLISSIREGVANEATVTLIDGKTQNQRVFVTRHIGISEGVLSALAKKIVFRWAGSSSPTSYMVGGITTGDTVPEGRFVTAQSREGLLCAFKISPKLSRVYFYKETSEKSLNPFKGRRPESFLKTCMNTSTVASMFDEARLDPRVMAAPYIPRYALNPSRGIFTLIGDAAGPSHPLGGQGMSTAAADGIRLAELLKKYIEGKLTLAHLNSLFNQERRERYLNSKFVSEWLSFIIGGMGAQSRALRQLAIRVWSQSDEARAFCGKLFGGSIEAPLTVSDLFNIWGLNPDFSQVPVTANIPSLFYRSREISPGRFFSEIIK